MTLDNPVWSALTGRDAHLAVTHGRAARYLVDVAPFAAVDDPADPLAWADLANLLDGETAVLFGDVDAPAGWTAEPLVVGLQMLGGGVDATTDPTAVPLGAQDVPKMLDLVRRTQPGPFLPRTFELGGYVGLRMEGRLVAMAGERFHPAGWTEISAVCTDPQLQGRGLAKRVVRSVVDGIRASGSEAFLHVMTANTGAIGLYRAMGFEVRREMPVTRVSCTSR